MADSPIPTNRRSLLRSLLGSPLLLAPHPVAAFEWLLAAAAEGDSSAEGAKSAESVKTARDLIAAASDAINVFDFEPVAERNL